MASVMSRRWVARQPPPRLNNQQLPPASPCGGMRGAGAGGAPLLGPRVRAPPPARPPPHPLPREPPGKAGIPPKAAGKPTSVSSAGAQAARTGERDSREEGGGCDAAPDGRRQRWHGFPCPHPVPSWGALPLVVLQRPPRASVSPGERCS